MKVQELKGQYDAIFSLGSNCSPAIQLQKNNLRPYAGVLDWLTSYSLTNLNILLRNRFVGFMELQNMSVEGIDAHEKSYVLKDRAYNIASHHDFPIHTNTPGNLVSYFEFKGKLDRRIRRFLDKTETSKNILFIRTGGTYSEMLELHSILSSMVRHEFKLILINYTAISGMIEHACDLDNVALLEMQGHDIWRHNDHLWRSVFDGINFCNMNSVSKNSV